MRRPATILAIAALAALPATALALTFGTPEDLPTNGAPAGDELRLGATSDGTVVAAWPDHQPGPLQVKASVRPAGGAFGAAQELSPDGVYGELLHLGVSPQGHAVAFWREDGTEQVRFAVRPPGGAFGPAADVPMPAGYAGGARFDVGSGGATVVIYPTDGPTHDELVATFRDPATGSWSAFEQVVSVPNSSLRDFCGVKLAPSGDALALYESRDGAGDSAVRTKYRPAGGAWVNEQSFTAGSGCQSRPGPDRGLDVDASGRFALLWFDTLDTLGAIRGPGQAGIWTSTVIMPGDQPAGQTSSLATDDAGNVVIGLDLGSSGIVLARYSATSNIWDTSTRFAQTPGVTLQGPRVGADRDSGAFVVAMRRMESGADEVVATGADGPAAAFGPLTRLGADNDLYKVSAEPASGGTWAIGFEEFDGSQPDEPNKLKVVLPGGATATPTPGPGDPGPATPTPGPGDPGPAGGGTPAPTGSPTPAPGPSTTTGPAAVPAFATLVRLPSAKRCVKRRASLRIRLRLPAGLRVARAVITVNGKRFKVVRGAKLSKPIALPRRARRVKVTLRLADGREISGKRTYRRCPRRRA